MIKDFVVVDILDEPVALCEQGETGIIRIEGMQKVLTSAYNALTCPSSRSLGVQGIITSIEQTNIVWAFARLRERIWALLQH